MREAIRDVHRRRADAGDRYLHHYDGLALFGLDRIARYASDQCHPSGDGIGGPADLFDRLVVSALLRHAGRQ